MEYIPLEKPIAELEIQIEEFRRMAQTLAVNWDKEIEELEARAFDLRQKMFLSLTPYETVQLSRHPRRPNTLELVAMICDSFVELHGDRNYYDDQAIVGGLGTIQGKSILWIGHQKGRGTKENIERNFGMPKPEGYRKALRLMSMAERFQIPIVTFIDTPGAYPGIGAEQRGQSEAIGKNIMVMSRLKVPILTFVIGEGGSGGALAIGVANRVYMLGYATYSVISPEGCASILMKDAKMASQVAQTLGLTAERALSLKVIDGILPEPLGGSHRDPVDMAKRIRARIEKDLAILGNKSPLELRNERVKKFMSMGAFSEPSAQKHMIIAIDGPAGAGKSSICQEVSRRLGLWYVNTGALYRAYAWLSMERQKDPILEVDTLSQDLHEHLSWDPKSDQVFYRGQSLSGFLYHEDVGQTASRIAQSSEVRQGLLSLQRRLAAQSSVGVLVDGRDMGTVVFPEAKIKIFLTASIEKRAERRLEQLKRQHPKEKFSLDVIKKDIKKRDDTDQNRLVAPLKVAQGAKVLDTSNLSFEESVKAIMDVIQGEGGGL